MQWLQRAAGMRPDTIAVDAEDGALTYAELHARARAGAIELRGAQRVAIALPAGLDFAVALHACLLAGAAAVPVDLREPTPRLAGATIVDRHPVRRAASRPSPPAVARRARPLRAGPRRPHLGHHGHAAAGRAHARPGPPERARRRRHPRPRPRRALALPAPAQPRGRADGAAAVRDLRDDRGPRSRHARGRHDRVARPDPARAADRPPAPADAAGRDAGRRARGPHAARPRPRGRLAGRADLRAHAGVLGGHGRPAGGHRDLRPPASRLDRRDRRRRRDRRQRPTSARPATSGGSTSAAG